MHVYLKIKIMSLAAEARIIRREARTWPGQSPQRVGLHEHRVNVVRRECRAASLAYAFLRGRAYRSLEARCHEAPDWYKVQKFAERYGEGDKRVIAERARAWIDAAKAGTPA